MLLFLVVHTKSSPARYKHQAYSENSTQHVKEQLLRGTVFGKGIPILATKKLSGGPNLAVKGGLGYHFGCHKKSPDRFDRTTFGVTTLALFISHSPHCQCHSKLRNRRHFYVLLWLFLTMWRAFDSVKRCMVQPYPRSQPSNFWITYKWRGKAWYIYCVISVMPTKEGGILLKDLEDLSCSVHPRAGKVVMKHGPCFPPYVSTL